MNKALRMAVAASGGALAISAMFAGTALLGISPAHADTQDQQFLNLVHSNGVGGQDDSLIAYAHEFCNTDGQNMWDTALPLARTGH